MEERIALRTLEAMGYATEDFQLMNPDSEGRTFTYYLFAGNYRPELMDRWDIVGVYEHLAEPWLADVRFFSIDEDLLENGAMAFRDAYNSISFDPAQLLALVAFFETTFQLQEKPPGEPLYHFRQMSKADLLSLHFPEKKIGYYVGSIYYYSLGNRGSRSSHVGLFHLPLWSSQFASNQNENLWCRVFQEGQEKDPMFVPLKGVGIETVTFNRSALTEFIWLLKQHSYENRKTQFGSKR